VTPKKNVRLHLKTFFGKIISVVFKGGVIIGKELRHMRKRSAGGNAGEPLAHPHQKDLVAQPAKGQGAGGRHTPENTGLHPVLEERKG
jgi:hypothetical protein